MRINADKENPYVSQHELHFQETSHTFAHQPLVTGDHTASPRRTAWTISHRIDDRQRTAPIDHEARAGGVRPGRTFTRSVDAAGQLERRADARDYRLQRLRGTRLSRLEP